MEYEGWPTSHCWCGNDRLVEYSPEYLRCPACETLVIARMPDPAQLISTKDESGFYGRNYYEKHLIEKFGFPSLPERARADLPERCVHWLRTLLRYRLPPGRVLELGSAHGGFVALLRWAGFDAVGLEVSPWLVEFARRTFDVPMLLGPIEQQELEPGSFDVIVAMDLMEHLPDPVGSLKRCAELLRPDGLLMIQTPCFPAGKAHDELLAENAPFLDMMVVPDHLFLYSRQSLTALLARVGLSYVRFEPNLFPYDMFLVASPRPPAVHEWEQVTQYLAQGPASRLVVGLLDLDSRLRDLGERYAEAEADRAVRLQVIERQGKQLGELEADRNQLRERLHELQLRLAAAQADREAMRQALASTQEAQQQLHRQIAELHERLGAAEADRAARLQVIERQGRQLGELETARAELTRQLEESRAELDRSRQKQAVLRASLAELEQQLASALAERDAAAQSVAACDQQIGDLQRQAEGFKRRAEECARRAEAAELEAFTLRRALEVTQNELRAAQHVLMRLGRSSVYKLMRVVGLWSWIAERIVPLQSWNCTDCSPNHRHESGR